MKPEKRHFVQIINDNRGTIASLCKVYYTNTQDREDALQDVILQLWKSFDTFRGEAQVSTWIYRVTLNTILAKVRRDKKSLSVESIDPTHVMVSNAGTDDHQELLLLILRSLKDIDKAIVVLFLEGYRNKEIAEMLNISPTNVGTRFNRIKTHLKMKFNHKAHATERL